LALINNELLTRSAYFKMRLNGGGMKCWGFRGRFPINLQKSLPAGDAPGKPIKPQYFIPR